MVKLRIVKETDGKYLKDKSALTKHMAREFLRISEELKSEGFSSGHVGTDLEKSKEVLSRLGLTVEFVDTVELL